MNKIKIKILLFAVLVPIGYFAGLVLFYHYWFDSWVFPVLRPGVYFSAVSPMKTFGYVFNRYGALDFYVSLILTFLLSLSLSLILWVFLIGDRSRKKDMDLKGSAKWANRKELKRSEMLYKWHGRSLPDIFLAQSNDAVVKRKHGANYYTTKRRGRRIIGARQGSNVLVIGGTGDGKGIGTIVPTLLSNRNSVVCFDPKGENFDISGGFRQSFGRVQYFDPQDRNSTCHFNPFDFIRRDPDFVVTDVQNLCNIIVPQVRDESQKFWTDKARTVVELLMDFVLMYREIEGQTLFAVSRVQNTIADDVSDYMGKTSNLEFMQDMVDFSEKKDNGGSNVYMYRLMRYLIDSDRKFNTDFFEGEYKYRATLARNMEVLIANILQEASSPETVGSYMAFVSNALGFYSNENVACLMDKTSFSVDDLLFSDDPMSVYLCIASADLKRCKTFVSLFVSCLLNAISSGDYSKKPTHPLLFMLDEFPQLGYMEEVEKAIKLLRGFGVSFMIVIQSLADLQDTNNYGREGAMGIVDNCNIVDIKGVSNTDTAKWVSDRLGSKTIIRKKKSQTIRMASLSKDNDTFSTNYVEDARPLLYPDEIARLSDQQIILRRRGESCLVKRAAYFEFDVFKRRVKLKYNHEEERNRISEAFDEDEDEDFE